MSKRPNGANALRRRHLEEAFQLAQMLTTDSQEAPKLLERAVRAVPSGLRDRFALLGGVVRESGVSLEQALAHQPAAASAGDVETASPPSDPIMLRAGRSVRDRLLLLSFASAPPAERGLLFLTLRTRASASDVAAILRAPVEQVAPALKGLLESLDQRALDLASESEQALFSAARTDDPAPEALARTLDTLLAPVPAALAGQLLRGTATPAAPPKPKRRRRWPTAIALILAVAMLGLLIERFAPRPDSGPPTAERLLDRVLEASRSVEATREDDDPESVERYLRDRGGRRLTVPDIEGAPLQGLALTDVGSLREVPVLLFRGEDRAIPIFVLTYGMLEAVSDELVLESAVLAHIQTEGFRDVHDEGPLKAVVFRNRDDIYIAVTGDDARALAERIRFPS